MKTLIYAGIISFTIGSPLFGITVSVDAGTNGFTGWNVNPIANTGDNGTFLGTSGTAIDSGIGNQSWGLYATNATTSSSTYDFGSILGDGESVSIDVSLGFINTGGTVGIGLQNSSNTNRFESYYIGGDATDAWKINDAGGQENITGPDTTFNASTWQSGNLNFLTLEYTQLAGNTYEFSVNGTPITNGGKTIAASDISQIRLFNFNAGSGSTNDQFFNNLEAVPEPGISVLSLLGFGLIAFHRRRK